MNSDNSHQPPPNFDSDERLGELLRELPRDQASFGFEERVLRQVRARPNAPMTLVGSLKFAAPLAVAAVLGFVLGPGLMERSATDHGSASGTGQIAGSVGVEEGGSRVLRAERGPSNLASQVSLPSLGAGSSAQNAPGMSLNQIRSEAARVRQELEQLRNTRSEAGATVAVMLANGVEVQIDVRDLYEVLQQRAEAIARMEREALPRRGSEMIRDSGATVSEAPRTERNPAESTEPPLW